MEKKYEIMVAGTEPAKQKQKYLDTAKRMKAIVEQHERRNVVEYMRGIAHNFQLQNC